MGRDRGFGVRRTVRGGVVAAAAALALLATGCQEGEIPTGPGATPPPATGQAAPPSAEPTEDGVPDLFAADYVLAAGPETEGFESSGGVVDEDADASLTRREVAECVGVADFNPSEPFDESQGDTFTYVEESEFQATSRAKILPEVEILQYEAIVTNPAFGDCYRGALEERLAGAESPDGFTYEIVAVETPPPPRGATALIRTSMGISDEFGTYGYVFDTVYFYVGNVAVELEVHNIADVPPPTIEQGMIDQIAGKLADQ
ncbi:hypothetical protein I6A84_22025 [Frankia sp. CNm7]|uniref:Uncharacterized protein n=1 Tax=Frankia nepalensis TaxID=1836974 RepID=A0A937RCK2_9ACTN|nr:hypothetical protein [Frankia nepalensis]MBL7501341.1 hypothetical protein [Frankia nepalensis]MBL7509872.1 hypothetical protein [Frankia nepalensis]MBL7520689.1 hypothetical protein [Frankia nepalensis]MBL7629631.1 hypothetical protein [Frankia nepalensis]